MLCRNKSKQKNKRHMQKRRKPFSSSIISVLKQIHEILEALCVVLKDCHRVALWLLAILIVFFAIKAIPAHNLDILPLSEIMKLL